MTRIRNIKERARQLERYNKELKKQLIRQQRANMDLVERVAYLTKAASVVDDRICQILGKALNFPWYKDDQKNFPGATVENGVCVGDLIAEDLARMAAETIEKLEDVDPPKEW